MTACSRVAIIACACIVVIAIQIRDTAWHARVARIRLAITVRITHAIRERSSPRRIRDIPTRRLRNRGTECGGIRTAGAARLRTAHAGTERLIALERSARRHAIILCYVVGARSRRMTAGPARETHRRRACGAVTGRRATKTKTIIREEVGATRRWAFKAARLWRLRTFGFGAQGFLTLETAGATGFQFFDARAVVQAAGAQLRTCPRHANAALAVEITLKCLSACLLRDRTQTRSIIQAARTLNIGTEDRCISRAHDPVATRRARTERAGELVERAPARCTSELPAIDGEDPVSAWLRQTTVVSCWECVAVGRR